MVAASLYSQLKIQNWGLIDYTQANEKQLTLVDDVFKNQSPGYIIFCTHPEIVTLGRATKESDLFSWNGPIAHVSRGGRATYHGPSQLIIYPIVNLKHHSLTNDQKQNVVGHLRWCEQLIIDWLQSLDIIAHGKSIEKPKSHHYFDDDGTPLEETGVWVRNQKIASLGIAVKNWITYHGMAINLHQDPNAYRGLNPCGFKKDVMISVEDVLDHSLKIDTVIVELIKIMQKVK